MATIIFDLDDTLYNTAQFKKDIEGVLISHGFHVKDARESYIKTRSDGYTFEKHLKELAKKYGDTKFPSVLPKLLALFEREYIFPEAIETLKQLKNSHNLILLSLGAEKMQRLKIDNAGIEKYFDSIYITTEKKEGILKNLNLPGKIYFINNNTYENEAVRVCFPHFIIIETQGGEPVVIPDSPLDKS